VALPPEPLSSLLPHTTLAVVGEVVRVDDLEAWPADARAPIDGAPPRPAQRVTVRVGRVLHGTVDAANREIALAKPAAAYALAVGVKGVFLVDEQKRILGRYGPDMFGEDEVVAALSGAPCP
jgi:hypothetical protein